MATITLSSDHGWLILAAAGIGLQLVVHGGRFVGMARRSIFNAEYYQRPDVKLLLDEHKKATGEDKFPKGGYPDMGNGRYSALLSYGDWYKFNNAQRAHYNYVEGASSALTCLLLGGIFHPRLAAGAGAVYIVGRELYATGYAAKGPSSRSTGGALSTIALLFLFGLTVYGGASLAGVPKLLGF